MLARVTGFEQLCSSNSCFNVVTQPKKFSSSKQAINQSSKQASKQQASKQVTSENLFRAVITNTII